MDFLNNQSQERLVRAGDLVVDLESMEWGFKDLSKFQEEIWNYITYRESFFTWPLIQKSEQSNS